MATEIQPSGTAGHADLIIKNGRIATQDARRSQRTEATVASRAAGKLGTRL